MYGYIWDISTSLFSTDVIVAEGKLPDLPAKGENKVSFIWT